MRQLSAPLRHLVVLASATSVLVLQSSAEPVPVMHPQGSAHGFVVVTTLEGKRLATGDMTQIPHGGEIVSRLLLRFEDGSVDDDTTVFTQNKVFRLVSDHHIQQGPSFPNPLDMLIKTATGQVTWRSKDGKLREDHLDLPKDLANGLPPNLLMNVSPSSRDRDMLFLAPGDKPRLIHIKVSALGEVPFTVGGTKRKAIDYRLQIKLGGVAGAIAPMIGKQPPDFHIWILGGPSPAFIREEGTLYLGGPIWRVQQVSPEFPY